MSLEFNAHVFVAFRLLIRQSVLERLLFAATVRYSVLERFVSVGFIGIELTPAALQHTLLRSCSNHRWAVRREA